MAVVLLITFASVALMTLGLALFSNYMAEGEDTDTLDRDTFERAAGILGGIAFVATLMAIFTAFHL